MKILNVIASMDPESGGPCQGLRNSIPELKNLGCHNYVICLDDPSASFLGKDPFPVVALGRAQNPWAYSSKLLPWLIENLPQFDVVIIHGLWLYHGYAVHKALSILQKSANRQSPTGSSSSSSNSQPSTINSQPSTSRSLPRHFIMSHGMLDPYFQRDPSRLLKAIRNWFYWKLIEGKVINGADGILFTCEEELLLARQTFRPYRPQRELNVGYGVAEPPARTPAMAEAFAAACPGLEGQPYLLFLSRIHPKKGVDLLIRAYAELVKSDGSWQRADGGREESRALPSDSSRSTINHPLSTSSFPSDSQPSTINYQLPHLVIAGPLDSAYAKEMQELAEKLLPSSTTNRQPPTAPLGTSATVTDAPLHPPTANRPSISPTDNRQPPTDKSSPPRPTANSQPPTANRSAPRILFPGMLSGDAKWGAFHGCDAFVLPSHQENFGIAVAEALACGKPVLISKRVNIWREIEANGGAFTAEDHLEGAKELLRRWFELDVSHLAAMQGDARCVFDEYFTIKSAAVKMEQAIAMY